jgi:hypothetical protein
MSILLKTDGNICFYQFFIWNRTIPLKNERFKKAFNTSAVRLLRLKGINFVLINSMAMEMDSCFLCEEGRTELNAVQGMPLKKIIFKRHRLLSH